MADAKSLFRFKQFSVKHDATALKVNTDSVLLGSWADFNEAKTILDIGTGTGILALMAAQKNHLAQIIAIEIEEAAAGEAEFNFQHSVWSERLKAIHADFNSFVSHVKFDFVISNPPYFSNSFKSKHNHKTIARHDVSLSHSDLLKGVVAVLSESGTAFFIIPSEIAGGFLLLAESNGLYCTKKSDVSSVKGKQPYVSMLKLSRKRTESDRNDFYLFERDNSKSQYYRGLTEDFYLD